MFRSKEILNELVELNSSIKTLIDLLRHFPDIPNALGRPKKSKVGWPKGKKRGPYNPKQKKDTSVKDVIYL